MGRDGELWDDSALINAFDEAIFKYKKMHGKGYKQNPNTSAADCNSDAPSALDATSLEDNSNPEKLVGRIDDGSHAIPEVGETENLESARGNELADLEVPGDHKLESSDLPLQDQSQNHSTSVDMNEYNQLCKQYYEVEEQKEQILLKLQNFSNYYPYSSEAPVSGAQWGTSSASQVNQSSTSQLPCGGMVISCCSCACQYPMAPCPSLPCPSAGVSTTNHCVDPCSRQDLGKQLPAKDDDIVKMAMRAVEQAISTLKDRTSDSKEENQINNGAEESASPGTDLSVVLNAWYSAGFYTGKYLTEQSLVKKQHD